MSEAEPYVTALEKIRQTSEYSGRVELETYDVAYGTPVAFEIDDGEAVGEIVCAGGIEEARMMLRKEPPLTDGSSGIPGFGLYVWEARVRRGEILEGHVSSINTSPLNPATALGMACLAAEALLDPDVEAVDALHPLSNFKPEIGIYDGGLQSAG